MIAYFDCFSGISGDMILGALVDAGVSPEKLEKELSRLRVKGYTLSFKKVRRAGFRATKVNVNLEVRSQSNRPFAETRLGKSEVRKKHQFRKWKDVKKIVDASSLSKEIKQKGLHIFRRLFEAEAKVHGSRYDRVHLHELGAVDCIVDIFGALIGLDLLGIDSVYASPVNLGSGNIKTEHGILSVPAPAAIELLKGKPVYSSNISFELTTPTGAVLISSLASDFGPMPNIQVSNIGIGSGNKNFREQPNILRVFVGTEKDAKGGEGRTMTDENIAIIETNIDDMNPQVYEYVMDLLFKAGALDVFLTQIIMKKGRPGIKLSALCEEEKREELTEIILRETTSIGVRFYNAGRKVLQREIKSANTKYGKVNVKVSKLDKGKIKSSVEYEDCKKIAKKFNVPLLEVMRTFSMKISK
ncbi:MAG: nickel pincer cofactor biosynthesis protein LarC [Nitrospirota bacterium]